MGDSEARSPAPENPSLDAALKRAETYLEASRAANTRRGYESDFRLFRAWCCKAGVSAASAAVYRQLAFSRVLTSNDVVG